jgi:prepilin-type N-terminal cleavage/methylation domain-containing protein
MTQRNLSLPHGDEAGVTLIEIMVVLVVVSVGVLALSGVQMRSSADVYSTGRHTRALQVAQQRIEIARGGGFALAVSDSGTTDGFAWRTLVDSADVGLRRVRVSVNWTDKRQARSVQLNDLVAQR